VSRRALVVMVGKAGSGKTTLLRSYAAGCRRALIADPEQDWQLGPGDELIESAAELLDRVQSLGAVDPAVPFRLVYRDDADRMAVAAPAVAFAVRNLTLVYDELVWLCHAHYLPDWFRRVLQVGRKRRINLIGTTREPQEIHDMVLSQANLVQFFRVDPGNGLDRIRRRYPQLADELPQLPPYEPGRQLRDCYRTWGDESVLRWLGSEGR
jgi:hypothetical protein